MGLRCILHVGKSKCADEVKKIDKSKWEKLLSVVQTRKTLLKVTKYDTIVSNFPEVLDDSCHGYHSKCYKNFTAVPKVNVPSVSSPNVQTRGSEPSPQVSSSTGVLKEKKCIFCGHVKSSKGETLGCNGTHDAEESIRKVAHQIQDTKLFSIVGDYLYGAGPKFSNLEVRYHHSCRPNYLHQGEDKVLSKERFEAKYA